MLQGRGNKFYQNPARQRRVKFRVLLGCLLFVFRAAVTPIRVAGG